ncbi:acetyl-CoA carboxylase carboxyltransferase subunit alpha [Kiritimatiella glycovorans]|uniref:Acetyl-coenzyme A carboxylase carboxyl transferase subunit alpha n=1 Tax=Kiritimatiella glycovorans TaxID=1307763 RepID=A0A0G3EHG7_9BACT|nr:acetyl-CoA carboxylase carboxyltransferase subunit alpha [Kiritimatiella glycovorans]AKJ64285.1 Acetyl-coenzyme A carboxylase carboxyl transferase subunit alpha [Kiritimatiella glycovorans]
MSAPLPFEKPIIDLEEKLRELEKFSETQNIDVSLELERMKEKIETTRHNIYSHLTPWQRVQLARHPERPLAMDYVDRLTSEFMELHGDRRYRDDRAIFGGPANIDGRRVMVIGTRKGRDTKSNLACNFGCAYPEGYRKALRLMKLADRFGLPIVTLIDTPGAYPGIESEERHIAEAIAVNLREMFALRVPIVVTVTGEGGSGGALGIGVGDRVLIFENSYYSVISPEGCAAILWKDRSYADRAAEVLGLTADRLKELGLVDEILSEPVGGAHADVSRVYETLKEALLRHLDELSGKPTDELIEERYRKFRAMGRFTEEARPATPGA